MLPWPLRILLHPTVLTVARIISEPRGHFMPSLHKAPTTRVVLDVFRFIPL